jgi:hypothetical protein
MIPKDSGCGAAQDSPGSRDPGRPLDEDTAGQSAGLASLASRNTITLRTATRDVADSHAAVLAE